MNKNLFSFLILTLLVGGVACDREKRSSRSCTYDGSERFGVNVDGRFRGGFAEYIPANGNGGIAIFRNGLIPAAADLRDQPNELRDVTVFALEKGKVTAGVADLVGAQFITIEGLAAKDDEGCLVVDELIVEVAETKPFSGILTAPQQNPSDPSTGESTAVEDDIDGPLGDDLE